MSKFKFGSIVATLEDLEQQTALEEAEVGVPAAETATEVAEVSADADGDAAEVEQTDAAIDDAEGAQEQIGELVDVAQDSLVGEGETVDPEAPEAVGEQGEGLSEGEATLVEITHETILKNLGITHERKTYTAESFGSKETRRQTTLRLIASLEESKEGLGAKIVSALKAAFDMVVGFISKILANRSLMEKHLTNLIARATAMKDGPKKENELSAGAAQLSLNGQANPNTALQVLGQASSNIALAKVVADRLYRSKSERSEETNNFDIVGEMNKLPDNGKGRGVLGGGKAFVFTNGNTEAKPGESSSVDVANDASPVAEKITAPSKSEILSVLNAAKKVLVSLKEAESIRSRLKDIIDFIKLGFARVKSEVTSRVGSAASKAEGSFDNNMVKLAKTARVFMSKLITAIFSNAFKSVKAAADYAAAGMKNIGGEAAPAAPGGNAAA